MAQQGLSMRVDSPKDTSSRRQPRKAGGFRWLGRVGALAMLMAWLLLPGSARAQDLSLQLESEDLYANLPFVLQVVARGFDENPAPTLSKLAIPGCRVTALGVTPQVASMMQIINGVRSDSRQVTYVFRFRVEAATSGPHMVPALTATQGSKRASSQPARFLVKTLEETQQMQLRLVLPDRPLWVGETVDGTLEWYLRGDVGRPAFSLPLFDQEEWVEVEPAPAPATQQRLRGIQAGSRALELPYEQGKSTLDGVDYTRFRFQFRLTPNKPGTLIPAPARVMAEVQVGYGRDLFGFQVPQSRLYQALSKPLRIEIRPMPQAGRPPSFKNAVGSAFAIDVQAGRTVVRVGDPIELKIVVRGRGRLSGLILPDVAAMGLAPAKFTAPEEPPAGEVIEDGKAKLFRLAVRLRSQEAAEVPALSFAYFDPETGRYQTVQSQPIALSVKGSAVVAAADVVAPPSSAAATANAGQPAGARAPEPAPFGQSLVGADLALSDERLTLHAVPSLARLRPLLAALYVLSGLVLGLRALLARRQQAWRASAERQQAIRRVRSELERAASEPARDLAPRLATSLRALRRQLGLADDAGRALVERLETESYAPSAAGRPLSDDLRTEIAALLDRWSKLPAPPSPKGAASTLRGWPLWLLPLSLLAAATLYAPRGQAQSSDPAGALLSQARASYQAALAQPERDRRLAGFAQAEAQLAQLASAHSDCPELLTDWGNAALLSQEPGRAIRAYRLALRHAPSLQRAQRNLSFVRDRLPDWLPRPRPGDGLRAWLVLPARLATPLLHVVLAAAVLALALLALAARLVAQGQQRRSLQPASASAAEPPAIAPTPSSPARWLGFLALLPGLLIFSALASLLTDSNLSREAVVLHGGAILRSADSSGAPPAFAHALPAGAELRIDEQRGQHTRVRLSDGQSGWLASSALQPLLPEEPAH